MKKKQEYRYNPHAGFSVVDLLRLCASGRNLTTQVARPLVRRNLVTPLQRRYMLTDAGREVLQQSIGA
jgi:hypothetical protein